MEETTPTTPFRLVESPEVPRKRSKISSSIVEEVALPPSLAGILADVASNSCVEKNILLQVLGYLETIQDPGRRQAEVINAAKFALENDLYIHAGDAMELGLPFPDLAALPVDGLWSYSVEDSRVERSDGSWAPDALTISSPAHAVFGDVEEIVGKAPAVPYATLADLFHLACKLYLVARHSVLVRKDASNAILLAQKMVLAARLARRYVAIWQSDLSGDGVFLGTIDMLREPTDFLLRSPGTLVERGAPDPGLLFDASTDRPRFLEPHQYADISSHAILHPTIQHKTPYSLALFLVLMGLPDMDQRLRESAFGAESVLAGRTLEVFLQHPAAFVVNGILFADRGAHTARTFLPDEELGNNPRCIRVLVEGLRVVSADRADASDQLANMLLKALGADCNTGADNTHICSRLAELPGMLLYPLAMLRSIPVPETWQYGMFVPASAEENAHDHLQRQLRNLTEVRTLAGQTLNVAATAVVCQLFGGGGNN